MLRLHRNRKAQAVMGEYVVVISMVMAAIVGMTVYFKRAVQARIYDARNYMVNEVRVRTEGSYEGNLYYEYEPYYIDRRGEIQQSVRDETRLLPGGDTGIFTKEFDQSVTVRGFSETLPPKKFNATTPQPAGGP